MVRRGSFIGGQDNLSVPDAPTIGAATASNAQVSVAFTGPSDVGDDPITEYAARVTDGTNTFNGTASSSPITVTGLTNGTSYTAQVWAINDYGNGPLSAATSSFTPALHRGIFGVGKDNSGRKNTIDYVSIASTGNATDFGDATLARQTSPSLMSSSTRAVFAAGYSDSVTYAITIDYVTIASTGNATDFGDLSVGRYNAAGCSNATRGIHFNGDQQSGTDNTIDYITIASTGNATDFGDMNITTINGGASSSPTRGVRFGGGSSDEISYITIASTGNALDFGNLTVARYNAAGASSNTRVCMAGGEGASKLNTIDYITTASTGNATDFGDLGYSIQGAAGTSNSTRGLFAGGEPASGIENFIEYITIASTGNGTNFGTLSQARATMSCGSDAHGGIS
jgi:hypothetical protein